MTEEMRQALVDLKARQESGEYTLCPRCGEKTMKPVLHTNALSRHAPGIFICDECGTSEAMLDFIANPLPIEDWAVFRLPLPDLDFRDVPGEKAWEKIRTEHGPVLIRLYERWLEEQPTNFRPFRQEAFRKCPGLTQIWERPFQAVYAVREGELILRFRETDDGVEIAPDILRNRK